MEDYEKIYKQYLKDYEIDGERLICLCPFHEENTPSFNVNLKTGLYYCFGCQEKGNATTFVAKIDSISNKEAWKKICKLLTYTLDDYSNEKMLPIDFLQSLRIKEWFRQ